MPRSAEQRQGTPRAAVTTRRQAPQAGRSGKRCPCCLRNEGRHTSTANKTQGDSKKVSSSLVCVCLSLCLCVCVVHGSIPCVSLVHLESLKRSAHLFLHTYSSEYRPIRLCFSLSLSLSFLSSSGTPWREAAHQAEEVGGQRPLVNRQREGRLTLPPPPPPPPLVVASAADPATTQTTRTTR